MSFSFLEKMWAISNVHLKTKKLLSVYVVCVCHVVAASCCRDDLSLIHNALYISNWTLRLGHDGLGVLSMVWDVPKKQREMPGRH